MHAGSAGAAFSGAECVETMQAAKARRIGAYQAAVSAHRPLKCAICRETAQILAELPGFGHFS
jgi:hypothetical protein